MIIVFYFTGSTGLMTFTRYCLFMSSSISSSYLFKFSLLYFMLWSIS